MIRVEGGAAKCGVPSAHSPHTWEYRQVHGGPAYFEYFCKGVECQRCEGVGWLEDETACGDPECCSPIYLCTCNPDGLA